LVFESNTTDGITLHQYQDTVSAGLTKSAGCVVGNGAHAAKDGTSVLVQAVMSALVLCWLLVGV
jgi:hypothetical protein